jgi:predicted PurR-regulated permease PerM
MKSMRITSAHTSRYLSSGPLVWAATIICTTLLLVLLKRVLWLVVPFLFAIILYYALFPAVKRLTLAGVARETAAALVAGAFFVAALAAMLPTLPWLAAQAVTGEEAALRYLAGGRTLVDHTLVALESQFGFLRRMEFSAEVGRKLAEFSGSYVQEHLTGALLGVAAWLPAMLLAPFFAFFFLRDGQLFTKLVTREVPNAFFERTILMFDGVDATARNYFQGLLKLTAIDTVCLGAGLWAIGVPGAFVIGLVAAVFEWIPIVGTLIGGLLAVLVAATALPNDPGIVYWTAGLFVFVRMLDNFFFIPLTVGRSLQMHPLPTVLMVFIGGAVAGIPGLILALPVAGVVSAIVSTIGGIVQDPRLRARNAYARALLAKRVNADFGSGV